MSWVQNWSVNKNKIEARVGTEIGMKLETKFEVEAKKVNFMQ